jgi:hypothetical protein
VEKMKITTSQSNIILIWNEYANEDSCHYGGPVILLPNELRLVNKLKNMKMNVIELDEDEIEMVGEWMHKTINRKYGNDKYITGIEKEVYEKIAEEINKKEEGKRIRNEENKIIKETKFALENKLQNAGEIVRKTQEIKKDNDKRSIEEKMKAALELKKEIEEIESQIKNKNKNH